MHYRIDTRGSAEAATVERLLHAIDPAALVDADAGALRVSTIASANELAGVLREAGASIGLGGIARVPSECCGGCGG